MLELKESGKDLLTMSNLQSGKLGLTEKPTNLSKRQREEILNDYFNAKKQM